MKDLMVRSIDQRLCKVDQTAEADDGTINASERGKAKHFGGIITDETLATRSSYQRYQTRLTS